MYKNNSRAESNRFNIKYIIYSMTTYLNILTMNKKIVFLISICFFCNFWMRKR